MSRRRWLSCPESRVLYIDPQGAIKSLTASYTDREPETLCQRAWALAPGPGGFRCFFFSLVCRAVFSSPPSAGRGDMACLRESWFIHTLVQPHACHWPGNLCSPQVITE